ncbi:hypothetical protein Zmor_020309 [Zophobas morio]|uniref:Retinol dehydrogenase 11 n=1 Tax=Zophobas morio TaxID=2755281 RepID=A0AA38I3K3_9CUCU|nr:hypothetical protein Zmor_020309 [Zophobas morio]
MSFLFVIIITLASTVIFKIYLKLSSGWCRSQKCLAGKTAVVTGANTGIGFETALDFAKRGAKVILACRNSAKAAEARRLIIEKTENTNIHIRLIDFSSFASVRSFAKDINKNEDRLDILVNNAGVMHIGQEKSEDGYYMSMQVNYFSMFLLTNLLLELLKKTDSSRIINVSSFLAKLAFGANLKNICKHMGNFNMYCRTKLYIILFTKELARQLKDTNVTTYSLHPGAVQTNIYRHMGKATALWLSCYPVKNWLAKTSEEGAQTTIYCSVEKNIEMYSGRHFEDCRAVDDYYYTAKFSKFQEKLWKTTQELVGLNEEN